MNWLDRFRHKHSAPPLPTPAAKTMHVTVWDVPGRGAVVEEALLRLDDSRPAYRGVVGVDRAQVLFTLGDDVPLPDEMLKQWHAVMTIQTQRGRFGFDIGVAKNADITLPAPMPEFLAPSRLHVAGRMLVSAEGVPTPLRSHSCFLALARVAAGQDIRPVLRYIRDVTKSNAIRVFALIKYVCEQNGLAPLTNQQALMYLDELLSIAASEGLAVDLALGDAQELLPNHNDQHFFATQLASFAEAHPNLWLLENNEPWKNGLDPFGTFTGITNVLCARGSAEDENSQYKPPLSLYDQHTERSLDEDGYKWVRHQFEQWTLSDAPQYFEEPMGCAEVQVDGRRDNKPAAFAQAAVVGEFVGCGWGFHPEYGIRAELPRDDEPNQQECALAVGQARIWLKPEMQAWPTRTRAGLGDSAVELDDAHALRCIMRLGAGDGQVVAVRPRGYVPRGHDGWRIVNQSGPDGAFIDVAR